ncbi:hypothetical protein MRX96_056424 [Rhipicephalus microplus]
MEVHPDQQPEDFIKSAARGRVHRRSATSKRAPLDVPLPVRPHVHSGLPRAAECREGERHVLPHVRSPRENFGSASVSHGTGPLFYIIQTRTL